MGWLGCFINLRSVNMFSIRKVMLSIMAFILSVVCVKANPGNYVLKFGVKAEEVCSGCRRKFSETRADMFSYIYSNYTMLFGFKYEIFIDPTVDITNRRRSYVINSDLVLNYDNDCYWDARPQAFIDLDESPQKMRCLKCMVNHAKENGCLEPKETYGIKGHSFQDCKFLDAIMSNGRSLVDVISGETIPEDKQSNTHTVPSVDIKNCLVCTSQDCCIVRDGKSKCMVCKETKGEKFVCPCCLGVVAHTKCLKDGKFKCNLCKVDDVKHIEPRKFIFLVKE